jgi:preprotein translocase subunit SecA
VRLEQRFPYVFHAAHLLEGVDHEDLSKQVLDHLNQAHRVRQHAWGEAELRRLSAARIDELDSRTRGKIEISLGEQDYPKFSRRSFSSLTGDLRRKVGEEVGRSITVNSHRHLILMVSDQLWVDYLTTIEGLRTSIGLEAYAQRDPLTAYKSQAFDMFQQLLIDMRAGVVSRLFTWQPQELTELDSRAGPQTRDDGKGTRSGRNEPCWCGSGKKFKNCHMRNVEKGVTRSTTRSGKKTGKKKVKREKSKRC